MTQWGPATITGNAEEADMANKDKGGRSSKKVATRSLKEKRQAKKAKRAAKSNEHKPL